MRRKDAADPLEPRFFSFLSWRYCSLGVILGFKVLSFLGSDPGPARYLALLKLDVGYDVVPVKISGKKLNGLQYKRSLL